MLVTAGYGQHRHQGVKVASFGEFGGTSTQYPQVNAFIYSHHLSACQCIDFLRRNPLLIIVVFVVIYRVIYTHISVHLPELNFRQIFCDKTTCCSYEVIMTTRSPIWI